nr:DUF805 domain-containing protein [uncultured Sphingomonas sp.]
MTTKSIWSVGRFGRGTMLLLLLAGSIGFNVVDFLAFKQLNLMINIGFRFDALPNYSHVPLWRTAAEIAFDILLLIIAIGRLHDVGRSGWWLSGLVLVPLLAVGAGLPSLALLALIGWIALLFWPGTLGPNLYGPDRLGWESREQYEAQKLALEAEAKSWSR